MAICDPCREEADAVRAGRSTHAEYARMHDDWQTWGADHGPTGHVACTGCYCQHKPVGTAEGKPKD